MPVSNIYCTQIVFLIQARQTTLFISNKYSPTRARVDHVARRCIEDAIEDTHSHFCTTEMAGWSSAHGGGPACNCTTENRRADYTVGLRAATFRLLREALNGHHINMRLIKLLRQQLRRHSTLTEQRRVETVAQDGELSFAKAAEVLWSPAEGPSRLGLEHWCDVPGTGLIGTVTNGG